MVNLAKYRGVVAQMYKDRFDVYRHGTETDANGATHQVCYQIPAMSDQPCQISPEQTDEDQNSISLAEIISSHEK